MTARKPPDKDAIRKAHAKALAMLIDLDGDAIDESAWLALTPEQQRAHQDAGFRAAAARLRRADEFVAEKFKLDAEHVRAIVHPAPVSPPWFLRAGLSLDEIGTYARATIEANPKRAGFTYWRSAAHDAHVAMLAAGSDFGDRGMKAAEMAVRAMQGVFGAVLIEQAAPVIEAERGKRKKAAAVAGTMSAKTKARKLDWQDKAAEHARALLDSGTARHNIVSKTAARFGKSDDATRKALKKKRVL